MNMLRLFFIVPFFLFPPPLQAQQYAFPASEVYRPDRLKKVVFTEAAIGIAASTGLYFLWYKKFPRKRFHFFNDNNEWLQIDKVGHATTAYNIAVIQNDLMRWSGVKNNQSMLIGAATAITYMSIIEVLDGFSSHWGFSKGDMLANITGAALFAAQQKSWGEQRASLKFSFHATPFSKYNPGELGNNWRSRLLKDYNGQTYWLSFNIHSFLLSRSGFPYWLNAAVGYGGEGMITAVKNPSVIDGKPVPAFERYRQFYIAPDIDFFRVPFRSFFLNHAFYDSRFIKIPAPALEYNGLKQFRFHPFYF